MDDAQIYVTDPAETDVRLGRGRNVEATCGCWEKGVTKDVKSILRTIVAVPVAEVAVSIIGVGVVVNVGEAVLSQVDDGLSELSALRASIPS